MKYCPQCGTQLPDDAKFCGNCRTLLEIPKPKEELKYCPHCGREIIKGTKFCVGCGVQSPSGEQPLPNIKPVVEVAPAPPPIQYQQPALPIQPTYQPFPRYKWQTKAVTQQVYVNTSPEDVTKTASSITQSFKMKQKVLSTNHILAEGKRDYRVWVLVLLVILTWIGALIYYFTRKRNRLSIDINPSSTGTSLTIFAQGRTANNCVNAIITSLR